MLGALTAAGIILAAGIAAVADVPPANPKAVQEVKSGKRKVANASWWGFDPVNATAALQAAIDSGVRKVIVPDVGHEWIVDPLFLASDQEVLFEKGVVVAARRGGFTDLNDCLFRADRKHDIKLSGYGATLRMNKPEYTKGEWRHCLELDSCTNVKVLGLTMRDSGGDGIYIGNHNPGQPYCRDVIVSDCMLVNNRRQGMSVITAVNLLVERCIFRNTGGTAPQAGVDLEPNEPVEKLVNCVFRDCSMENNQGPGILVYLGQLNESTEPLSVRFERCRVTSDRGSGIEIGGTRKDAPSGLICAAGCMIQDCQGPGLNVFTKSSDAVQLRFDGCHWRGVARSAAAAPMRLEGWRGAGEPAVGGIDFAGCTVDDDRHRPFLAVAGPVRPGGVADVRGAIAVRNPFGAHMDLGSAPRGVRLRVRAY